MANVDAPRGLRLVGSLNGRAPSIRTYYVPSSDEVALFVGDAVKSAGGADGNGILTVAQAAATNPILGVVVGIDQVRSITTSNLNLYRTHRPADTAMYVYVCDDPNALYEIQADDDSATLAAADIGLNADIVVGTGDTVTGMSAMELDTDSKQTTATLQLKIVSLVQRPDNEAFSEQQKVLVKINNHQYGSHTGTAGVS